MIPPCGEWVEELRRSLFKKTHILSYTHTHTGRAGRPFRPRQEGLIIFNVLPYKEALRGPAESLCIINTALSLRPGLTHTHATLRQPYTWGYMGYALLEEEEVEVCDDTGPLYGTEAWPGVSTKRTVHSAH